jgi:hypothetical protein
MMTGFNQIVLTSQVVNLIMGIIGASAVYGILMFLDWHGGIKFTVHIQIIDDNPMALALYRGLRFLAVAYFVATLLK